ncbi:V/A-type H+-transporting ATPase subunit E [Alkalibacterium putridalgicola]|uniref:V-type sodium ATP synthase subunit E n=1 Tax=Alkalibacterium putridalgicola TaxID=426703 RepID=A0A1H7Q5R6_9LACT|nr:V-type ATP synthase subunit E family protein [Alkalibacterium putridalgicola]GEK88038.1 V-type sodium ATP synthase subunit E [Alkalibacterium putridalgicola]SEL43068.1 V/A-type H+-transporting ATPase subunit E [Alkalibacterium putridalgicola]
MADLKLLTERVVEKEKTAIRQRVEEARENAEDEIQAARAKEEQDKIVRKQTIDEQTQQKYKIRLNTLEVQKRNNILAAKQRVLSKVLEDANQELNQIQAPAFKKFLADILTQFKTEGSVELILGEKTSGLVSQEWIDETTGTQLQATLSNETVDDKAGVLVQKEGVEYNFMFDALIEDSRSELIRIIAKELFN